MNELAFEVKLRKDGGGDPRVALVTGAARGIGLGIAAWLIAEGWRVVLADTLQERGALVAETLGERAWFVPLDVSNEAQVEIAVNAVLGRFGRLDALVNNAGLAGAHGEPLPDLDVQRWNRVLAVNLTGAMLMTKHCAPHLRSHAGAVVNIASTRALQSEPDSEAYAASKGGLLALTHAMAISLGPDIRVNVILPGWIDARDPHERVSKPLTIDDHDQHPVGRVGEVEDVAALVAWLLDGAQSGFVTGESFVLDGGMTRKMIYL